MASPTGSDTWGGRGGGKREAANAWLETAPLQGGEAEAAPSHAVSFSTAFAYGCRAPAARARLPFPPRSFCSTVACEPELPLPAVFSPAGGAPLRRQEPRPCQGQSCRLDPAPATGGRSNPASSKNNCGCSW